MPFKGMGSPGKFADRAATWNKKQTIYGGKAMNNTLKTALFDKYDSGNDKITYTKGQWKIKHEVPGIPKTRKHHEIYLISDGWCIGWVNCGHHWYKEKQAIANAALIAAAPELLDALKKLVGWYDCFQLKEGEADLPVIVKSRAAIAKAENTTC